jgi:hypothetical protein
MGSDGGLSCTPPRSPSQTCNNCLPSVCAAIGSCLPPHPCQCGPRPDGLIGEMTCLLACFYDVHAAPSDAEVNECRYRCGGDPTLGGGLTALSEELIACAVQVSVPCPACFGF